MGTARLDSAGRLDIYNFDKQIQGSLESLKKLLSQENYELILKYDKILVSLSQSKASRLRNLKFLKALTLVNKNQSWLEITEDQIQEIVYQIMKRYSPDGQETWTTYDHKKVLKEFVRWLKFGSRSYKEVGDPIETKHVKINRVRDTIAREDLLTDKDLSNILAVCTNLRDKALIHTQWEAGTRPGEILNLKLKHVQFDNSGIIRIKVDGKTGARAVTLVESVPDLIKWINTHPFKENPEAPLWIVTFKIGYGKQLSYASARRIIMKRCQQSGLGKRIYLNLFRHSEATRTAQFMTDAQLKKRHGWSVRSNMPARYVHMQDQDVENAILNQYGISKKKEEKLRLPLRCQACEFLNSADIKLCEKCGRPLDLKTALDIEEKQKEEKKLYADSDTVKGLENRIEEAKREFQKEIDELRYGPTARGARFAKAMLRNSTTPETKIFGTVAALLFEFSFTEEKKRAMMKEIELAERESHEPDFAKALGTDKAEIEKDVRNILEKLSEG
ncbi:MAG: tyrosine-type recombinase/integrase, partial [Nitrosopumilaceae archaeon]